MRIKADSLGLEVEDYNTDRVEYNELYDGFFEIDVDKKLYDKFDKDGKIDFTDLKREDILPTPNCFFKLKYKDNTLCGRYIEGKIKKFILGDGQAWGLRARMMSRDLLWNY